MALFLSPSLEGSSPTRSPSPVSLTRQEGRKIRYSQFEHAARNNTIER